MPRRLFDVGVSKTCLFDRDSFSRLLNEDDRMPALEDPGVHRCSDWYPSGHFERVPEVCGGGIGVAVGSQIMLNAASEVFRPQELFEHSHYSSTLFVGQDVIHRFSILR